MNDNIDINIWKSLIKTNKFFNYLEIEISDNKIFRRRIIY